MPYAGLTDIASEDDIRAVARLMYLSFGGTLQYAEDWVRNARLEKVQAIRDDRGQVIATLTNIPMGQYFGGRSVPMTGIAGVGIEPGLRGRGLAQHMMTQAMRQLHREGVALSSLYASTQSLYRKAGFEQAGYQCWTKIPLQTIGVADRELEVRPLRTTGEGDGPDDPIVRRLYNDQARRTPGMIDRGRYLWRRVHELRGVKHDPWGVFAPDGTLEGYAYLGLKAIPPYHFDLAVSDLVFSTPRAGRRLLSLLADFGTTGDHAILSGGAWRPLLALMPLQRFEVRVREYWMNRVTHVEAALAARGYAPGVRAEVTFDVADALIPENAGVYTLRVEDGTGRVTRAAAGSHRGPTICADIRGVAAIYTGFMTPQDAALAGLAAGPEDQLALAASVFAGPAPTMTDSF